MAKIKLLDVRITFPNLWEAKSINDGKAKYGAGFVFDRGHPAKEIIVAAMVEVAKAKWGDKYEETFRSLKASNKLCLHDGDEKSEYQGYAGNLFINATNEVRPLVLGGGPVGCELAQAFARLVRGHGDEVMQLQHTAGAGLERLAVRPVHGAEAEVLQ